MVTRIKSVPNRPEADVVGEAQAQSEFHKAFEAFNEAMNPTLTLNKRMIISVVASVATYALGAVTGLYLASWLSTLAFAVTGLMFVSLVIELLVAILAVVAAMLAGGYVARYISTGQVIEDFNSLRGWASRKFSSTSTFIKSSMVH